MVASQRGAQRRVGYNHLISTSASGIIVLLQTPTKYRECFSTLFVKTSDFSAYFSAYNYHIWRAWYNGSYAMMAKPIRALELHYSMIQFLIKQFTPFEKSIPMSST